LENKETFNYIYSAKEQEELKRIREKYYPGETDKMTRLRNLYKGVNRKASVVGITVGIMGALILGFGMSLIMSDLGNVFGLSRGINMIIGSVIGVPGIVLASFAYPLHNSTLKREREKIAPEIIKLTDELIK